MKNNLIKINIKKKTIIIFGLAVFLLYYLLFIAWDGNILDDYYVMSENEFHYGSHLICNPGCDGDPLVERVKSVAWNKKYIIVEQLALKKDQNNVWYIVKANGERLYCCHKDTLIGPLTKQDKDKYVKENNIKKLTKRTIYYFPWTHPQR